MKKLGIIALLGVMSGVANAQFADGTIAVVSVSGTLANTGNQMTLKDFSSAGVLQNSVLTDTYISGTSTSEGMLNYSDDGTRSLWVAGYSSTAATAVNSSTTNRRVQGYNVTGSSMGTATDFASTALFSGNNCRSAVVVNGNLVVAGAGAAATSGGTRLATGFVAGTTPSTSIYSGTVINTREAQVWGSNMYWSTGSGTPSIFMSPLGSATPTDIIATKPTVAMSPYDFVFVGSALYVADDSTANGGILKFTQNGSGTFDFAYRMVVPTIVASGFVATNTGARGIGFQNGTIYATTSTTSDASSNQIVSLIDNGTGSSAAFGVVATAATNERFRGLEVVPEPASFAILGLGLVGLVARRKRTQA